MEKELMESLKAIKKAIEDKDKTITSESKSDATNFMDKDIVRRYNNATISAKPNEPKCPIKPYEPSLPMEPNYKEVPEKKNVKVKLEFTSQSKFYLGLGIAIIIVAVIIMISGFTEIARGEELLALGRHDWNTKSGYDVIEDGTRTAITGGCLALIGTIVSFIPFIVQFGNKKKEEKAKQKEKYNYAVAINESLKDKYLNELEEYPKKIDEYNKLLEKYTKEKAIYDVEYSTYLSKKAKYEKELANFEALEKEYEKELENAKIKMRNYNKTVRENAEKRFLSTVSSLSVEFPMKYIDDIDSIIEIFEDKRADTLKEAIEALLNDKFRRNMELEQTLQRLAQEEINERAERAREQCYECRNRYRCPDSAKKSLSGPCPNYH